MKPFLKNTFCGNWKMITLLIGGNSWDMNEKYKLVINAAIYPIPTF
jgi:hypothetical protein